MCVFSVCACVRTRLCMRVVHHRSSVALSALSVLTLNSYYPSCYWCNCGLPKPLYAISNGGALIAGSGSVVSIGDPTRAFGQPLVMQVYSANTGSFNLAQAASVLIYAANLQFYSDWTDDPQYPPNNYRVAHDVTASLPGES